VPCFNGNGITGWCEVGDSCRMTGDGGRVGADPLPTRRVLPPRVANSSSSMDISPSERAVVRIRGDALPSLKACKLACAFSRSLIIISCIYGGALIKIISLRDGNEPYQNLLCFEATRCLREERTRRIKLHECGRSQTQGRATGHYRSQDNLQ
jgi:hypothetical protein